LIVFVTGTGTDIGKTWVASTLARELRARGVSVRASKPLASGWSPGDQGDAEELALACGQDPEEVCPLSRRYGPALAPVMAAQEEGRSIASTSELACQVVLELVGATGSPGLGPASETASRLGVALVEGAGGLRSPYAPDGDCLDFACVLEPDVVILVSGAELGCLHEVRSCVEDLVSRGLGTPVVVLNRFDATNELHLANEAWLREREGWEVYTEISALADHIESGLLGSQGG
jgi:dethiobiotin synthetase